MISQKTKMNYRNMEIVDIKENDNFYGRYVHCLGTCDGSVSSSTSILYAVESISTMNNSRKIDSAKQDIPFEYSTKLANRLDNNLFNEFIKKEFKIIHSGKTIDNILGTNAK